MVRVRMTTGGERTLPVLPPSYPDPQADTEDDELAPRTRESPLGSDHVGRRPLSKEVEADNLEP